VSTKEKPSESQEPEIAAAQKKAPVTEKQMDALVKFLMQNCDKPLDWSMNDLAKCQ